MGNYANEDHLLASQGNVSGLTVVDLRSVTLHKLHKLFQTGSVSASRNLTATGDAAADEGKKSTGVNISLCTLHFSWS